MLSVKPEDKTMSKPGINLRNSSTYHTLLASTQVSVVLSGLWGKGCICPWVGTISLLGC